MHYAVTNELGEKVGASFSLSAAKLEADMRHAQDGKHYTVDSIETVYSTKTLDEAMREQVETGA